MKIGKTILAFLLATLTLTLVACRSEKKNLTESSGDDVSSRQSQSQPQESFSFTTTDLDGHEVSFEDYSDAKVIMFNMWEPWCGPCRGELPDLQRLYKKYTNIWNYRTEKLIL